MGRYTRTLPIIAFLYASLAVASLAPVMYQFAYIPTHEFSEHPEIIFVVAWPFLNGLLCIAIAYSFFALRNWGRYLAITYNMFWIGYILLAFTAGFSVGDFHANGPTVVLFIILVFFLLITFILFKSRTAPGHRSAATY